MLSKVRSKSSRVAGPMQMTTNKHAMTNNVQRQRISLAAMLGVKPGTGWAFAVGWTLTVGNYSGNIVELSAMTTSLLWDVVGTTMANSGATEPSIKL
jgi:hypothetical protein